jgi:hypothetical protein
MTPRPPYPFTVTRYAHRPDPDVRKARALARKNARAVDEAYGWITSAPDEPGRLARIRISADSPNDVVREWARVRFRATLDAMGWRPHERGTAP